MILSFKVFDLLAALRFKIVLFESKFPPTMIQWLAILSFSATQSLALRDLGFDSFSSGVGTMGLTVIIRMVALAPHPQTGNRGGQIQPLLSLLSLFLIIPCSNEW